ncbi:MAG: hypothetical protein ACOWWR_08295 [Eubacteriales bacterium]
MERTIKTAETFHTKAVVCTNKYDTNLENTAKIESFCKVNNLPFEERIPFDSNAVKAINNDKLLLTLIVHLGKSHSFQVGACIRIFEYSDI